MDVALLALTVALILAPALVGGRITSDGGDQVRPRLANASGRHRPRPRAPWTVEPRPVAAPSRVRRALTVVALLARDTSAPAEVTSPRSVRRA